MSQRLGYVPALDGLRGVAILLVLWGHFLHHAGGNFGVDLFFVLSGFLITTLLLEDRAAAGRIGLKRFYVRRARRLVPALAAWLLVYLIVQAVEGVDALGRIAVYGTYVSNLYSTYVAPHRNVGLGHTWSLAEEEQFYVLWPLILMLLLRTRRALVIVIAVVVGLVAYRAMLVREGVIWWKLYQAPQTHSDGLLLGAAAALWRFRGLPMPHLAVKHLAVAIVVLCPLWNVGMGFYTWQLPLFEVAAAAMVLAVVAKPGAVFQFRPLVWIGKISYSLYLWHATLLYLFGYRERLLVLGLSFAVAYGSYRWVEQPFRRRRTPVSGTSGNPRAGLEEDARSELASAATA